MPKAVVVHEWTDQQSQAFNSFLNTVLGLRSTGSIPKGLELKEVYLAKGKNMAICIWDVDSLDHLVSVASMLKPSWKATPMEVEQKV